MLASFSYAAATSPVGPLDCHVVMKANSMFLLELASCGGGGGGGGEGGETTRRQLGAGSGYSELETVTELMSGRYRTGAGIKYILNTSWSINFLQSKSTM